MQFYLIATLLFFTGAALGSFVNAWAYRYVAGTSVWRGRSKCPSCDRGIPWYANIPLLSWLMLHGRCGQCGWRIPARYPLAEMVMGLWVLLCGYSFGIGLELLFLTLSGMFMLLLSLIDFSCCLLPDGFVAALTVAVAAGGYHSAGDWRGMAYGALFGAGGLFALSRLYYLIRRRHGLGLGDVKLMVPLGALVGAYGLPMLFMVASAGGLVYSCFKLITAKSSGDDISCHETPAEEVGILRIPFGPFLCFGAVMQVLFGPQLYSLVWRLGG